MDRILRVISLVGFALAIISLVLISQRQKLKRAVVAIGAFCGAIGFEILVAHDAIKASVEHQPFDSTKWIAAASYGLAGVAMAGYGFYLLGKQGQSNGFGL